MSKNTSNDDRFVWQRGDVVISKSQEDAYRQMRDKGYTTFIPAGNKKPVKLDKHK